MPKLYTTKQGDTWDDIAYQLYGDEKGMTALIEANENYRDYVIFPAGLVLKVPNYEKITEKTTPPWRA